MERFQTPTGSCVITEDEVQLELSRLTALKRAIENQKKPAYILVTSIILLFLLGWYRSGGQVVNVLIFLGVIVGVLVAGLIGIFYLSVTFQTFRLKRNSEIPEELVFDVNIPRETISYVESVRYLEQPSLFIYFQQNNTERAGVVMFRDGNETFDQAKVAFETAGISIRDEIEH